MDHLGSSSDVSSAKTASLASGILSSLSSLFGSNSATSGVFASLLAEEQGTMPVAPPPPKIDTSSASTQNTATQNNNSGDASQSSDPTSLGALKTLMNGLHRILDRLNKQNSNSSNSKTTPNAATASAGTASQAQSTAASGGASDASSSTDASGSDSDASDPTTLTGILSDLTALMKLMEKKLEAAQAGANNGTDVSQTADGTDSGTSSASDPLTQLLAMMQLMQKQLMAEVNGSSLTGAATATAAPTASDSPAPEALQDLLQIQKDLKGLLASLESLTGGASAAGSASSGASNGATAASTENLLKANDQSSSGKTSLAASDSIFTLFGNAFSSHNDTPITPAFSPANANTDMTGSMSGGSSGMTGQNGDTLFSDNGSANLNSLNANSLSAVSGSADTTKSVDPYAFASQLSAARAANGGTVGLPDAVEQVFLQINRGVKDGNDQMTIQLHPAELGKINVKLDISSDGQVRGTVMADNPTTLNMLHKDSRSLERALQEAGLRADPGSLQFSMSGGQSGNTSGQTTNNSSGQASADDTAHVDASGTPVNMASGADEIYYVTPGRVNLKV